MLGASFGFLVLECLISVFLFVSACLFGSLIVVSMVNLFGIICGFCCNKDSKGTLYVCAMRNNVSLG